MLLNKILDCEMKLFYYYFMVKLLSINTFYQNNFFQGK